MQIYSFSNTNSALPLGKKLLRGYSEKLYISEFLKNYNYGKY